MDIQLMHPVSQDGALVHALVGRCKPLDENSLYCNLLQCSHFAQSCVIAKQGAEVMGFISAYVPPNQPDCLFVWQVAVDERARGQGLAKRMLQFLLARPSLASVRFVETTITPDNKASQALFSSLANALNTSMESNVHFERETHFLGQHDSEWLYRIGPIA